MNQSHNITLLSSYRGYHNMKKIILICIIGILLCTEFGAIALPCNDSKIIIQSKTENADYTHTIFIEVGTATWCPDCPASNAAWHRFYGNGKYNFEYTELVSDKNKAADSRFNDFNPMWVPTSYWDGGEYVYPGTNDAAFSSYLNSSGSRIVPDLVSNLSITWLESTKIEINYSIVNNETSNYLGRLRIYIVELESTLWNDYRGNPYNHAFLSFAVNQRIDIPATGMISKTIVWNGTEKGFPGITQDNIQVILAVFGNASHESYSDPPSGNSFNAYFSDECIAVPSVVLVNSPPETPTIDGPTSGNSGTVYKYTISTTDPDGDDVYYCVNWSDDPGEACLGPFASGEKVTITHMWTEKGTYTIKVKARDSYDAQSDWATLTITMPCSYDKLIPHFMESLFQRFPNAFTVLRQLME
jgi:PKD domain